jgi:hypothetical protein
LLADYAGLAVPFPPTRELAIGVVEVARRYGRKALARSLARAF